jgi:hypothetical protein
MVDYLASLWVALLKFGAKGRFVGESRKESSLRGGLLIYREQVPQQLTRRRNP